MKDTNVIVEDPNLSRLMTVSDWLVFAAIIGVTFAAIIIGQRFKKQEKRNEIIDYLLMGRRLTLPMFVATLVATWYGGIFGVTQIAFEQGVYNFLTQGVFWYVTYIIFAYFMVAKIRKTNAVTLPDLLRKMFGRRSEKIGAIFNFFNVVPIAYAVSLGLLLQTFFGGNLQLLTFLGVIFVVLYSLVGGFRAVVFSDLVQFSVMCLAVALIFGLSVWQFGGIDFLEQNLPESHFSPLGTQTILTTMVWGLIALSTLVDPNFYQRCFAADSSKTAKYGILISTVVWILFDICTTAGAMYAAAVIPKADSSKAYLIYALQILPDGLRGFVLAGIVATILSTIDSYIFTASTTLVYDLGPKKFKRSIFAHHLGVIFTGGLAVLLAGYFAGNIKAIWKTLGSYSAACLLLPVLIGHILPGRISDKGFVFACLSGVIGTTVWRHLEREGVWGQIDDLYAGVFSTMIVIIPLLMKDVIGKPTPDTKASNKSVV